MKKYLMPVILAAVIAGTLIFQYTSSHAADKKVIVTTIFPVYDWVNNILGDNPDDMEVIMLFDKGVDQHSYQPTAEDIIKIASCDAFIYIGGESDSWVQDALNAVGDDGLLTLKLIDALGERVREEKTLETDESETPGSDEHIWLSPQNAIILCEEIEELIETVDPQNAEIYLNNKDIYIKKLQELDTEYAEAVRGGDKKAVVFCDRFPFLYLMEDYGIGYYAAFDGCSAEIESSFETIIYLASVIDELGLKYVLTIEGSDERIANTVIQNTNDKDQQILTLNSMQSVTMDGMDNSYISIMKENLEALNKALE